MYWPHQQRRIRFCLLNQSRIVALIIMPDPTSMLELVSTPGMDADQDAGLCTCISIYRIGWLVISLTINGKIFSDDWRPAWETAANARTPVPPDQ